MPGAHEELGDGLSIGGCVLQDNFTISRNAFCSLTLSRENSSITSAAKHQRFILNSSFVNSVFHFGAACRIFRRKCAIVKLPEIFHFEDTLVPSVNSL
jgi:hypothetical protein